jgi:hypothetical protein
MQRGAARENRETQWISQRWTLRRFDVLGVMHENIFDVRLREKQKQILKTSAVLELVVPGV